jgi:hypothetical protein
MHAACPALQMRLIIHGTQSSRMSHDGTMQLANLHTAYRTGRTFLADLPGCLRRPFSEEASSLPDISGQVIPESAEHHGSEPGSHDSRAAVPVLALDKLPNQDKGAPFNKESLSLERKPDTGADTPFPLGVSSPKAETLTSEHVEALESEALQHDAPHIQEILDCVQRRAPSLTHAEGMAYV